MTCVEGGRRPLLAIVLPLPFAAPSDAGSGLLGLDHELPLDQNGIWAREDHARATDALADDVGRLIPNGTRDE